MTPLSAFRSRIAPRVLTALDLTIDQAILDTCIDFCERTLIVKATLDAISTVAGVTEYDLDGPTGQNVCLVMKAWCDQMEMTPASQEDVNTAFAYAASISGQTAPQSRPLEYHQPAPDVIALYPPPDGAYQLTLRAACKPKRSAATVEDVLFENWVDEIVNGSLFRLFTMPGAQWTNPQLAAAHQGLYQQGVNRALIQATRGRIRAEQRITPIHI